MCQPALVFRWKPVFLFSSAVSCMFNFILQINSKYSEELAQECLEWIRQICGEPENMSGDMDNFYEVLKDGTLLCK